MKQLKKVLPFFFLTMIGFSGSLLSQINVRALTSSGSGYNAITSQGMEIESPDCVHKSFGAHVTQVFDTLLERNVFVFHSHIDNDNDRCEVFDRVRMEIKGGPGSLPGLQHSLGTTSYYRWKFQLPADFRGGSNFNHIFQNKTFGGDDTSLPLITITPRATRVELIHSGGDSGSSLGKLADAPLSAFLGRWVEVYLRQTHAENGKIEMEIKDMVSGSIILKYSNDNIDMWRRGGQYQRPKFGMYRRKDPILKDETIKLADFCFSEGMALCPADTFQIKDKILPNIPASFKAIKVLMRTANLSWTASTDNIGVKQYVLYLNNVEVWKGTALNVALASLIPNTIYAASLEAEDLSGNKSSRTAITFKTQAANTLPLIVINPSPSDGAANTNVATPLRWDESDNATSYRLYFDTVSSPKLLTTLNALSYQRPTAYLPETKYFWQVGAVNENGEIKSKVWSFTTGSVSKDEPWKVYRANQKFNLETNFWEVNSQATNPIRDEIINDPIGGGNKIFVHHDASTENFRWRARPLLSDTSISIVFRIKALPGDFSGICYLELRTSGTREKIRINRTSIKLERASPVVEVDHQLDFDKDYHLIRVTKSRGVTKVYLNENETPILEGKTNEATTTSYIEWGKSGTTEYGCFLDWIVFVQNEDWNPSKGARLPSDLFLSNDATLSNIKVNGIVIPNFKPDVFSYTVNLPSDSDIPEVEAVLNSRFATLNIAITNKNAIISVLANDKISKKTYTINFTITSSVYEYASDSDAYFYPNPTSGILKLDFPFVSKGNFILYEISGKEVMNALITEKSNLNLESLNKGTYLAKIAFDNKKFFSKKIILQH